ncbi:unnamed protein product [Ilex paraguariensis]|uniref:DUF3527 domain-containing protein n=1 Tax=Ilex paraguariensis TaxID=185542 RepID=A0ABC8S2Q6_9AQUA
MGYSLEIKTCSRQEQTSKVVKEKILSPRANRSLKFQDKCKVETPFGQPYLDLPHELRRNAGDGLGPRLKSSGNRQKQGSKCKVNKDDELVKHMSNLPGYLQRVERGENLQEKALNFGVLDWERLEKWKYNEKSIPVRGNTKASSSSSKPSFVASGPSALSNIAHRKTLSPQSNQFPSHSSHLSSSHEKKLSDVVQQSQGKVLLVQKSGKLPANTLDGQQNLRRKGKSSARNNSGVKIERDKRKEYDQKTTSKNNTLSLDWGKRGFTLSSHDAMSSQDGETKMRVEEEFNLAHQSCPAEQQPIVLLLPKHPSQRGLTENFQLAESRTSFEGKFTEAIGKRFPDCFSPEELCPGWCYEIPHSCPLPVGVANNADYEMKPCSSINDQDMELQSDASHKRLHSDHIPNIPSKGKCLQSSVGRSTSTPIETSQGLDQYIDEQPAAKGRNSSPSRRFSFNLGRMSRSFSFKESSAVPQLSSAYASVKSGPVRSETCVGLDNYTGDKANSHNRARASPLRRLLDPLLKSKGAHSGETIQSAKGNFNSVRFKPITANDLLQDKKREALAFQALLQLTMKNGVPFFKLVVDNSSDVLAAAVKKFPTSDKGDSSLIYAFYSVHEIKKKSGGWISQGSKGKSCGFGYNIVGQMKLSSSYLPDLTGQDSKDQFMVRESVLYGVDLGQSDKQIPEFLPNRELAAIVVKNPIESSKDGGEQRDKGYHYTGKGFECLLEDAVDTGENKIYNSTTVILPGGIHGVPNKGAPSPLINRWRSSGSCDCGGWDVGCRLQILTNQDQSSKISRPSVHCSAPDHVDLFVQGGGRESKPIFRLARFKNGLYSVEFNSPISLLQAFSICVSVVSSHKLSHFLEPNNLSEPKFFPEPMTQINRMNNPPLARREVHAKYVPPPPPSPVGRV